MKTDHIDTRGFITILILALLWGINYSAIKVTNTGFSPIFTSFARSVLASALGIGYCLAIRQKLLHRGPLLVHGVVVGVLFGLEFACLYLGLLFTARRGPSSSFICHLSRWLQAHTSFWGNG